MSVAGNLGRQTFPVPIGSIFLYGGLGQIPATYLECNGEAYDPVEYPLLFTALGLDFVPDLRGYILAGGPVEDVGEIIPAESGTVTSTGFSLTAGNIPTVGFDLTATTISSVVSADAGTAELMINPVSLTAYQITDGPIRVTFYPPSPFGISTFDLPTTSAFTNEAQTEVTPTIEVSGDDTNPAVLVLRHIIKAKY
jgi:hypothetical protein